MRSLGGSQEVETQTSKLAGNITIELASMAAAEQASPRVGG